MGLNKDEKLKRKQAIKDIAVCNKDGDKPYVFISYKSDNWEIVLNDIVRRLVENYGLNVYFDGDFETHNALWTRQFRDNMNDPKCKGVIAFLSDEYVTSYATLMELMYSQCGCQDQTPNKNFVKKKVIRVDLNDWKLVEDKSSTGLGEESGADGWHNDNAKTEKALFDRLFQRGVEWRIFDKSIDEYEREKKLSKELCTLMVREVLKYIEVNKKEYDGTIDFIAKSIEDACGKGVFNKRAIKRSQEMGVSQVQESVFKNDNEDNVKRQEGLPEASLNLWQYTAKGATSYLQWENESKNCIVKKGSEVAPESNAFGNLTSAKKLKSELMTEGVIINNKFVRDYECDKMATMINVLTGGSVSVPNAIKTGTLKKVDNTQMVSFTEKNVPPVGRPSVSNTTPGEGSAFVYSIFGKQCTAGTLAEMMHQVFDQIAAKYPQEISKIAQKSNITAVALKTDVDNAKLPSNKMNYFRAKKEHEVGGVLYYVSTRYGREQGIEQLKRMLVECGESSDSFQVLASPEKNVRS